MIAYISVKLILFLVFVTFEYSACCGSLVTVAYIYVYIYIYIYIYIYDEYIEYILKLVHSVFHTTFKKLILMRETVVPKIYEKSLFK